MALTVMESEAQLSKTLSVTRDGKVHKEGGTKMRRGTAHRLTLSGAPTDQLEQLARRMELMTSREALVCAAPPAGRDAWPIVSKDDLPSNRDAIARTAETFKARPGLALFGVDFDTAEFPPTFIDRLRRAGSISNALAEVHPAFADAAELSRASVSSGILLDGTPQPTSGQHRYYIASDGLLIAPFVDILAARLKLAGFLWGKIAVTGSVLPRTLFDVEPSKAASRLFYEADAVLADPRLAYAPDARKPAVRPGGVLDVADIAPLTGEEKERLAAMEEDLRLSLKPQADAQRRAYEQRRVGELIAQGKSAEAARRTVARAVDRHELTGDFEILLDSGGSVSVRDILSDPARYHRETCADPLEPEYNGGRNIAVIYSDTNPVRIYSQAHGGVDYRLLSDPAEFFEVIEVEKDAPAASASIDNGPGCVFPVRDEDDETDEAEANGLPDEAAAISEGWSEPVDLFCNTSPVSLSDPPAGSLPRVIDAWSRDESRRKGVSQAFASIAALSCVAAAIGTSLKIRPRLNDTTWSEPSCLWVSLVDDPGRGKSPIISAALAPLSALDRERWQAGKPALERWKAEAAQKGRKAALGPKPIIPRSRVDDVTSEKLISLLAENPRGLIQSPDELMQIFAAFGAYKANGSGDRTQQLRLFDGGDITVDRVGSGTQRVEGALTSILAGTQPEKIGKLARDLGSDGLLQRFVFVLGDDVDRGGGLDQEACPVAAGDYSALVRYLARADYPTKTAVALTPSARAVLVEAEDEIRKLGRLPGASPAWKGHVEKWGKILPRFMLIFHAIEQWELLDAVDPSMPVGASTAQKAARYCLFLMRHGLIFYERYFEPAAEASEAREIAGYLLSRPDISSVTRRTISDARKHLRKAPRELLAAMKELEDCNWLKSDRIEADGPARWRLNPLAHSRFLERAKLEQQTRARVQLQIKLAGEARKALFKTDSLSGTGGE